MSKYKRLATLFFILSVLTSTSFAFVPSPGVQAEEAAVPQTIATGYGSRAPIFNGSIPPHVFFDGANYIYVTPYGNYTWLQPLNILRFTNLTGATVIDKSVFVLQYEEAGNWLPLLNFENVTVQTAKFGEWRYFNCHGSRHCKLNSTTFPFFNKSWGILRW